MSEIISRYSKKYWEERSKNGGSDLSLARDIRVPLHGKIAKDYQNYERMMAHFCWDGSQGLVLDAGCGPGNLYDLGKEFCNGNVIYIGMDYVYEFLKRARNKNKFVNFCQGDVTHLPFKSQTIDKIIIAGVLPALDSFNSIKIVLREAHRILKSEGTIIVDAVPNTFGLLFLFSPSRYKAIGAKILEMITNKPFYREHAFKIYGISPFWLKKELETLNFEVVTYWGYNRPFLHFRIFGKIVDKILNRLSSLAPKCLPYSFNRVFFKARKMGRSL